MKRFVHELRTILAKYLWVSILYAISISVVVNTMLFGFVFDNFSYSGLVGSVIVGCILGLFINRICRDKLNEQEK